MWMAFNKKSLKKYNTQFIPVDSEHFTFGWQQIILNIQLKKYL